MLMLMPWEECMVHRHSLVVMVVSLVALVAKIKEHMVDNLEVVLAERMGSSNSLVRCRAKCMAGKEIIRIRIPDMEIKWVLIILLVTTKNGKRQKFLPQQPSEW